jgi:hypothetical protein
MATKQEIERLAYEMWERDGRPEGNDQSYYYEAERALSSAPTPKRSADRKPATAKTTASKPRATRKAA